MDVPYYHGVGNASAAWLYGMPQTHIHGFLSANQQTAAHLYLNGRPALQSNCQQGNYNDYPAAMLQEQLKSFYQQNQFAQGAGQQMVHSHNIHHQQNGQAHFQKQNFHGLMPTMSASESLFGVPPTFSLQSLQELSSTVAAPSKPVKPSHPKEHPFYWRRLHSSAPVEGMTRTKDKYRVVYTEKQRTGLEKAFKEHTFITTKQRAQLTKELDLSERQIKIWFQNRRAKERRVKAKQKANNNEDDSSFDKTEDEDIMATALPSCRFARGATEPNYSQCRFQGSPTANNGGNFEKIILSHKTPSSGSFRQPTSPTDWTTWSGGNIMKSVNISPLTSTTDLVTYPRP